MSEAQAHPIDFYFDFSSPYAYLLSEKIDHLAAHFGRKVVWRPILLGIIFQHTGGKPPADDPLKGSYMRLDVPRSARFLGVPFQWPERFPIATQAAARAYYWLEARDATLAKRYAHAAFRAMFMENRDISAPESVLAIATDLGAERNELSAALAEPELKEKLKRACSDAIARGVFGSPWVVVDGEAFWGADRLPQIEQWLKSGKF